MKRVFLEPAGRMHSFLNELVLNPPQGYEFIIQNTSWDKTISPFLNNNFIYYTLQRNVLNKLVPMHLAKAYLEGLFKRIPKDAALTYSIGHPIFRKEPWVVTVEWVTQLFGYSSTHLSKYRKVVEKALASEYCRKILCWSELAMKTVLLNLDCELFEHKVVVVPHAVRKKEFVKNSLSDKVKLLFVGSVNIVGDFEFKGGKEVLEAFAHLRQKYDNVELVVRSDMPHRIKERYNGMPGLTIIDKIVPWEAMEKEFKTADIFLFPGHLTPFMVLLDAMSYELPIVATDAYANAEIVGDGKTGLIINSSKRVPYYLDNLIPNTGTQFLKAVHQLDAEVVNELVEKTSTLIENPELRRKMGKAGRWEVEHGKFSIERRNEKLKRIFDEATSGNN